MITRDSRWLHATGWLAGVASVALLAGCAQTATDAPAADAVPAEMEASEPAYDYPFQDPSLTPEARAADLVSRLTLEEKAAQMYDKAEPIDRLGVRKFYWWNEALHGVARAGHHERNMVPLVLHDVEPGAG